MADHAIGQSTVVGHEPSARSGREHDDVVTLIRVFPRERVDDQLLAADCRKRRFGVKANFHCKLIGSGRPSSGIEQLAQRCPIGSFPIPQRGEILCDATGNRCTLAESRIHQRPEALRRRIRNVQHKLREAHRLH